MSEHLPQLLPTGTSGGSVYDEDMPVHVTNGERVPRPDIESLDTLRVHILVTGSPDAPQSVTLSSEADLFFHYVHAVEAPDFARLAASQKLTIGFSQYALVLARMAAQAARAPQAFPAALALQPSGGAARLDFVQDMEYKLVELLSCEFRASAPEVVQQEVASRYNAVKSCYAKLDAQMADFLSVVKVKSPSMLLQLQRMHPTLFASPAAEDPGPALTPLLAPEPLQQLLLQERSASIGTALRRGHSRRASRGSGGDSVFSTGFGQSAYAAGLGQQVAC